MQQSITITDVTLRDGLQNLKTIVSTKDKLTLASLLRRAGIQRLEAASFVSPKRVPQMADAEEIVRNLLPLAEVSALALNLKGLDRALTAGTKEIAIVLSCTETMNRRNIGMSLEQAKDISRQVLISATKAGVRTRAYLAVAFECPFEGLVYTDVVLDLACDMYAAGASEIILADTIGAATPDQIYDLLRCVLAEIPSEFLAMHLHDTRGMGLANAYAAIKAGVFKFDASTGGIGGCPFAPGAAGNLATEDLVLMANQSGLHTGVSLERLLEAIDFSEQILGMSLGGRSINWLKSQHNMGNSLP